MKPPHTDRRRWRLLATLAAASAIACLPGEAAPPRSGGGPASAQAHRPAPAAAATGAAVPAMPRGAEGRIIALDPETGQLGAPSPEQLRALGIRPGIASVSQLKRESEFYDEQSGLLSRAILPLGIFITIIMAVGAVFGAMNTMYAAVGSRTREIATLLVLGFSPFAIMVSFVFESVFLALIGGLIGCLIALPINGITTSTTNFQSFSEVAFAFRITPTALATGMIFAAAMGLVGGFLPALRAARQTIASSLRGG
ncbi:MAG: ABC transporter permease [Candidatus Eisenbacteria bacterium]|uniref:ABC transporter permease n=1 Tax=Eiseniibacteriota bacterium TaxID=2212470 RepID=A0A538SWJ0_UNCEI|nr:MAG: ABC transporter permease [Candidatus Eisenbacteria bacterium]